MIPASLPSSTFHFSILKEKLLFATERRVGRKRLQIDVRAFQDRAPLGELRARCTLVFSSHLLAPDPFMLNMLVIHVFQKLLLLQ